jgi:hypothetical protein
MRPLAGLSFIHGRYLSEKGGKESKGEPNYLLKLRQAGNPG